MVEMALKTIGILILVLETTSIFMIDGLDGIENRRHII